MGYLARVNTQYTLPVVVSIRYSGRLRGICSLINRKYRSSKNSGVSRLNV
jgi:hypothetical protein